MTEPYKHLCQPVDHESLIDRALREYPDREDAYLIGRVMLWSHGKANPATAGRILEEKRS